MAIDRKLFYGHSFFQGLPSAIVDALATKAVIRRLASDELWISRTEQAEGIAVIVEGGLRSTTFTPDGKEYVFSIMKKGDIWGLVSTIDGIHNSNDVYAHGATTIITIDKRATLSCMDTYPEFSRCLMNILCHRLRMANRVLEDRALQPIEVRLARLLISLHGGEATSQAQKLDVTQEMLARILGCTRPTVNRKLQELEQKELIEISYGSVRLKDIARLARLSGQGDVLYF